MESNENAMQNRILRFRAWDKKNKWMLDSFRDFLIENKEGGIYVDAKEHYDTPNLEVEPTEDLILMQFTGLHDKNGKEIWEGDILKFRNDILEVKWGKHGFVHLMFNDQSEVIGNVWENPELLKP